MCPLIFAFAKRVLSSKSVGYGISRPIKELSWCEVKLNLILKGICISHSCCSLFSCLWIALDELWSTSRLYKLDLKQCSKRSKGWSCWFMFRLSLKTTLGWMFVGMTFTKLAKNCHLKYNNGWWVNGHVFVLVFRGIALFMTLKITSIFFFWSVFSYRESQFVLLGRHSWSRRQTSPETKSAIYVTGRRLFLPIFPVMPQSWCCLSFDWAEYFKRTAFSIAPFISPNVSSRHLNVSLIFAPCYPSSHLWMTALQRHAIFTSRDLASSWFYVKPSLCYFRLGV